MSLKQRIGFGIVAVIVGALLLAVTIMPGYIIYTEWPDPTAAVFMGMVYAGELLCLGIALMSGEL